MVDYRIQDKTGYSSDNLFFVVIHQDILKKAEQTLLCLLLTNTFSFVNMRLVSILEKLPSFLEIHFLESLVDSPWSLCCPGFRFRISLEKEGRKILEIFLLLFKSYLISIDFR